MPTYIKRPRLGRKRETIIAYLNGEITQTEAARALNITRQNFPTITNNILRTLVLEGKIDITNLLKDY
jgi:DNA invertase Pin-like site-specific DNA recombinase